MAVKLNELKQKALDAKNALRATADKRREAQEAYSAILEKNAAAAREARALTDAEVKATADAKTLSRSFDSQVANSEELISTYEAQVLAEEKRLSLEDTTIGDPNRPTRIEIDKPNATKEPWGPKGVALGRFCQAVRNATSGMGIDPRLAMQAAATGMGENVGGDGGFALPIEIADGIEKNIWDTGQILKLVNDRPIDGNAMTFNVIDERSRVDGSRAGGVLGYWIDEGVSPTATQIKLARMEMKLRKVATLGYMTDELQADASALSAELQGAFSDELLFQVENAVINGTGAGQPQGILVANCLVTANKETNQAATTINTANLSKMWMRLPARSQANSVWIINVDTQAQLDLLSIPAGTAALEPRFVNYGPDGIMRIKGRPVIAVEYCATLGTVGDIILADFSRYRVIRKASGIEAASSMHVRFVQGESTFRAIYRVDGQPIPRAAITPFKGTNTLSPFVALQTR